MVFLGVIYILHKHRGRSGSQRYITKYYEGRGGGWGVSRILRNTFLGRTESMLTHHFGAADTKKCSCQNWDMTGGQFSLSSKKLRFFDLLVVWLSENTQT